MAVGSGAGDRFAARAEARRLTFGSAWKRIADDTEYVSVVRTASTTELPMLDLEAGDNVEALRPIVIDKVPLDCPLAVGDFILWPAAGTVSESRYRIHVIPPPKVLQDVIVKRYAVAVYDPDLS